MQLLRDLDGTGAAQQQPPRARQPRREVAQRSPHLHMATAPSRSLCRRSGLVALRLPGRAAAAAAAAATAHAFEDVLKVIHPAHPARLTAAAAAAAHALHALLAALDALATPLEQRVAVLVGRRRATLHAHRWRGALLPRDQRGDALGGGARARTRRLPGRRLQPSVIEAVSA